MPASKEVRQFYNYIDSLPPGSTLIVSFDHEASALPEIRPLALAVLRHIFAKGHKVIGVALLAEGTAIGYRLMDQVAQETGKTYGTDYVYLGFQPQYIAAILSMGESITTTFPKDYLGHPSATLPMLATVRNYADIAAAVSIADGNLTTHWMEYAGARYNLRVVAAVTAAMVTTYDPYLSSGQLYAMFGGLRGAAEYEQLLGQPGSGTRAMLAQSSAHIYIALLVILGNVVFFIARRKRGER